jgi:hypothetical protein
MKNGERHQGSMLEIRRTQLEQNLRELALYESDLAAVFDDEFVGLRVGESLLAEIQQLPRHPLQ